MPNEHEAWLPVTYEREVCCERCGNMIPLGQENWATDNEDCKRHGYDPRKDYGAIALCSRCNVGSFEALIEAKRKGR